MRSPSGERQDVLQDLLGGLARNLVAADGAMRNADGGVEHAQVIVNFGDGADGGARAAAGGFLLDGDGRAQAVDGIDFGPLHLIQELARIGGKRLHVAALALGVDGVEGERGLAGAAQPVITVKVLRGISTSIFFRLCWRAPCTVMRLSIWWEAPF